MLAYQLALPLTPYSILLVWIILFVTALLAFTMESERERYFYEDHANARLIFANNDTLGVNIDTLGFHLPELAKNFSGERKSLKIDEWDKASMKEFLDVALGILPLYNRELDIYPKAVRYGANQLIDQCEERFLQSSEVVEIIKMGIEHHFTDLIKKMAPIIEETTLAILLRERILDRNTFELLLSDRTVTGVIMEAFREWVAPESRRSEVVAYMRKYKFERGLSDRNWERMLKIVEFCDLLRYADVSPKNTTPKQKEVKAAKNETIRESFVFPDAVFVSPKKSVFVAVIQNPCLSVGPSKEAAVKCHLEIEKCDGVKHGFNLDISKLRIYTIPSSVTNGIRALHLNYTFPHEGNYLRSTPEHLPYCEDPNKLYHTREILFSTGVEQPGKWSRFLPINDAAGPSTVQ